ncbi:MAG: addiction module protein [Verrucomicrobia bacterium]|nr:addiction module protein [Verrucomicrobiota bacterium]
MTATAERLKAELVGLPEIDRAQLAFFLILSLEPPSGMRPVEALEADLARRAEEIHCGKAVGEPAERVLAELREKYS